MCDRNDKITVWYFTISFIVVLTIGTMFLLESIRSGIENDMRQLIVSQLQRHKPLLTATAVRDCQSRWTGRGIYVAVIAPEKAICMVKTESGEYVPEANISLK
jgi:hypothetical protein